MARVSLTDAAMCMNFINEFLFNIEMSYAIFSHWICVVQIQLHFICLT